MCVQVRMRCARADAPGARRAAAVGVGAPVRDGAGGARRAHKAQEGYFRGATGN